MNARYVSFAPARSNSAFWACRAAATRVKSTSNTECTCADVRRLYIMCSAILRRITDIGCTSTASPGWNAGMCRPLPRAAPGADGAVLAIVEILQDVAAW